MVSGQRGGRGHEPTLILDTTVSWENNDPLDTRKNIDIPIPDHLAEDNRYLVYVTNPSTEAAVDVLVANEIDDGGTPRYPFISTWPFTVPASTPDGMGVIVDGLFVGLVGRLSFDNKSAIGAAGAFTACVQVWMV